MLMQTKLVRTLAVATLMSLVLASCTRDPNVRKQQYMDSGKKYSEAGQYHEAAIQYSNAVQIDPRYAEAHYQLAIAYVKMGAYTNAYRELFRVTELDPGNMQAQLDLGTFYLAGRDPKRAQEKAELILQKQPDNADAHMLLANCYVASKDNAKALAEMHRAIELSPNRAAFYVSLAGFQANEKQFPEAEQNLQKALQLEPSSLAPIQALARFYEMQQKWPEAEQQLKRAIMVAPKDVPSRVEMVRLYMTTNRRAEAESLLSATKNALADDPNGYRLLGDFYTGTGEIDKAIAEFAALYAKHPKDLALAKTYARLLAAANHDEDAKRVNQEILKANPKDGDAIILKGQLLTKEGHPDQAVTILEGSLKNDSDNPVLHYYLGNALAAIGNTARAQTEWLEAVKLNPDFTEAQLSLAEMALRSQNLELLDSSSTALLKLAPNSPAGYLYRASLEAARKAPAKAEEDLKHAAALAPTSPMPYIRLGTLRLSENKPAEALQFYEKASTIDPTSSEALQGISIVYAQQQQYPKLVARLRQQIAKAPNSSPLYQFLGSALAQTKDMEGAAAAFQKANDLDKSNSTARLALAQLQTSGGQADKAISTYQKNIEQDPKDARSYFLLGTAYEAQGNWQKAEEAYKRVLALQPDNPQAANNLAFLMLDHEENLDVALTLAQTARRGLPDVPTTADTLAWAYYKKGIYSSAIDLLEGAVKKEPGNASFHYHLGLAYGKSGKKTGAIAEFEHALTLNPQPVRAEEIRKALQELKG